MKAVGPSCGHTDRVPSEPSWVISSPDRSAPLVALFGLHYIVMYTAGGTKGCVAFQLNTVGI